MRIYIESGGALCTVGSGLAAYVRKKRGETNMQFKRELRRMFGNKNHIHIEYRRTSHEEAEPPKSKRVRPSRNQANPLSGYPPIEVIG